MEDQICDYNRCQKKATRMYGNTPVCEECYLDIKEYFREMEAEQRQEIRMKLFGFSWEYPEEQ